MAHGDVIWTFRDAIDVGGDCLLVGAAGVSTLAEDQSPELDLTAADEDGENKQVYA